jgi:hypothetical protein
VAETKHLLEILVCGVTLSVPYCSSKSSFSGNATTWLLLKQAFLIPGGHLYYLKINGDGQTIHCTWKKLIKPNPAWLMMTSEFLQLVECWPSHCLLSHFSSSTVRDLEILHFLYTVEKQLHSFLPPQCCLYLQQVFINVFLLKH